MSLLCRRMLIALALVACWSCTGCMEPGVAHRERPKSGFVEDPIVRPDDVELDGQVVLGSPSITAGITGQGPLSQADLQAWLANPRQHEPIRWTLPLGLRRGGLPPQLVGLTRAKIELGRQLFFDSRLAKDQVGLSCSDCHLPRDAFAHPRHNSDSIDPHARAVLPVFDRAWSTRQFWDGRAETLEAQILEPIQNPVEMNNSLDVCVAALRATPGYRLQFERIYGAVTIDAVADAIAAFLRCLVCAPSPVDVHQELFDLLAAGPSLEQLPQLQQLTALASERPLSPATARGWALFHSDRTGCVRCHHGPNYSDEEFHNLGVGMERPNPDPGRFRVTGQERDRGAFKTPMLRNVARTAPYMHDGRFNTLAEVVQYYAQGGYANPSLSPLIRPLDLSAPEQADLVAFLEGLTSALPHSAVGRLPE